MIADRTETEFDTWEGRQMENGIWDRSVAEYPRLDTESSDEGRIMRAVRDCAGGVLFFPRGVYEIAEMLVVDNCCSVLMHKSAVLKAVR